MVRPAGLEPATLGLEGRCSVQMSYGRIRSAGNTKGAADLTRSASYRRVGKDAEQAHLP